MIHRVGLFLASLAAAGALVVALSLAGFAPGGGAASGIVTTDGQVAAAASVQTDPPVQVDTIYLAAPEKPATVTVHKVVPASASGEDETRERRQRRLMTELDPVRPRVAPRPGVAPRAPLPPRPSAASGRSPPGRSPAARPQVPSARPPRPEPRPRPDPNPVRLMAGFIGLASLSAIATGLLPSVVPSANAGSGHRDDRDRRRAARREARHPLRAAEAGPDGTAPGGRGGGPEAHAHGSSW